MYTLPAVVPEGEFPRSEIVAVRLARKVAPLFGVRWAHNPFGCTWVCDFGSLTLAEIARGAPLPSREERIGPLAPDGGWGWSGRAVRVPEGVGTPGALANATLNRFGPNTKAAVVLTAANRLLEDSAQALSAVCAQLNDTALSPRVRLAVWAGLVLEVFRAQPALVVAAIQARAVQRSLTTHWGTQVGLSGLGPTSARCEIGAEGVREEADPWHPIRLALIDDTLDVLDFSAVTAGPIGPDRREDIAAAWCRRLMQMGRPGSGMVWLVEDGHGHRAAHSYQRVGAMVAPFVAEVLEGDALRGETGTDPAAAWPPEAPAGGALTLRAHAVAVHVAVNYLRYVDDPAPDFWALREWTRTLIQRCAATTAARLGADDPAALLLAGYSDYLNLWDQARSGGPDASTLIPVAQAMVAGQRRTAAAAQAGALDPGAASYLLEIGNVALSRVRDQVAPAMPTLERALHRWWREALVVRGVDPEPAAHLDALNRSQVFHLANYAEHLAGRAAPADLRRALRIFEAVTEVRERVAANEPVALPAKHAAARDAHQAAAEVAARLADSLPARERSARSAAWAAAVRHALAVLGDPSTEELNTGGGHDMAAVWAARQIEPALGHLLDDEAQEWPSGARSAAVRLVRRALAHLRDPAAAGAVKPGDARLEELQNRLIRLAEARPSAGRA